MIVVKIELWPHGRVSKKTELGRIVIANNLSGDHEHGNYDCALSHAGSYAGEPGAWKTGEAIGYKRTLSPYHLLRMAINACLGRDKNLCATKLIERSRLIEAAHEQLAEARESEASHE